MYIDISLSPWEETSLLSLLFLVLLLALLLTFRPRLLSRGLSSTLGLRKDSASGTTSDLPRARISISHSTPTRSRITRWRTRWEYFRRAVRDNPDEFGNEWVWLPVPTLSIWTTFDPILESVGDWFQEELEPHTRGRERIRSINSESFISDRKSSRGSRGSIGLGIFGVDSIVPSETQITIPSVPLTLEQLNQLRPEEEEEILMDPPLAGGNFFTEGYEMGPTISVSRRPSLIPSPTIMTDDLQLLPSPSRTRKDYAPLLSPFQTPIPSFPGVTPKRDLKRGKSIIRKSLLWTYDNLSIPSSLLLSSFGVCVIAWQAGWSWYSVLKLMSHLRDVPGSSDQEATGWGKRSFDPSSNSGLAASTELGHGQMIGSVVQPIVPGWTVPFSHIMPIVVTLLGCQIWHEIGHLIAGSMDAIDPMKLALNVHLLVPAASVSFPTTIADLNPKSRMRLASAGAWNNLLTWGILLLLGFSRISYLFYHDYTNSGRVVLGVDSGSGLYGHLPTGAILEYLDDISLGEEEDVWARYLSGNEYDESRGWCVDKKRYLATQTAPCPYAVPVEFSTLPFNESTSTHCLPAYPLLTTRTWACPCASPKQVCVKPLPKENIMRIQWRDPAKGTMDGESGSMVVLWSGDRREVWHSVRVSRWVGRFGTVGRWSIGVLELFFKYTSMLSLSLAILNLLPLPYLDGAHILEAGLDYWYPNSRKAASTDIEEFEGEPLQSPRVDPAVVTKRRRIEQAILYGSSGLTATAFGGGLVMTALTALIGSDVSK